MKDYRITNCQSKELGFACPCPYCVYISTEGLKYFDDSVDENSQNWVLAKLMELEDRIKILEAVAQS